ncbi:hypothetical protein E2C01_000270 [Portunus trituberculatus]|uniref:Uncharacterized protein n=1 Tax=Portunus trituberculatus TaxID=210409 RepID=A0A5B7CEH1_PORTR|nr:hypothetical protein [Portunus trituberculatus]
MNSTPTEHAEKNLHLIRHHSPLSNYLLTQLLFSIFYNPSQSLTSQLLPHQTHPSYSHNSSPPFLAPPNIRHPCTTPSLTLHTTDTAPSVPHTLSCYPPTRPLAAPRPPVLRSSLLSF